jgi:hypothetical protein
LELKYYEPLSDFDFNFDLRRYIEAAEEEEAWFEDHGGWFSGANRPIPRAPAESSEHDWVDAGPTDSIHKEFAFTSERYMLLAGAPKTKRDADKSVTWVGTDG